MDNRGTILPLRPMTQNGNAAFHGGELTVGFTCIFLRVTRKTPPWKTALPGGGADTGT
jgi:hypothetical protein